MDDRVERLGSATGMVAVLGVGLGAAVTEFMAGGDLIQGPHWFWWTLYGVHAAVFAFLPRDRGPALLQDPYAAFVVQAVTAAVLFVLAPEGWTGVLLVVVAVTAAFTLTVPVVVAITVGQTMLIAVVVAAHGWGITAVVLNTMILGSFQGFAVIATLGQRKETEARRELAATHAELRAATTMLASSARDAERLRISRDLHDLVGHQLTGLALSLEVASHHADGEAGEHIQRARWIAKDLLRDVRTAVGELRAEAPGLESALRDVTAGVVGLEVDLVVDEQTPLDETSALTVVRCVQEVLTNTLRHAEASRLAIHVTVDAEGVRMQAHDDGKGTPHVVAGNGLVGMRERIEQLGGQVSFDGGGRGRGFTVAAHVPVSAS